MVTVGCGDGLSTGWLCKAAPEAPTRMPAAAVQAVLAVLAAASMLPLLCLALTRMLDVLGPGPSTGRVLGESNSNSTSLLEVLVRVRVRVRPRMVGAMNSLPSSRHTEMKLLTEAMESLAAMQEFESTALTKSSWLRTACGDSEGAV